MGFGYSLTELGVREPPLGATSGLHAHFTGTQKRTGQTYALILKLVLDIARNRKIKLYNSIAFPRASTGSWMPAGDALT